MGRRHAGKLDAPSLAVNAGLPDGDERLLSAGFSPGSTEICDILYILFAAYSGTGTMRRIAIVTGFAALFALTTAHAAMAWETRRPTPHSQPKPMNPSLGSSNSSEGWGRPTNARPQARNRPSLENYTGHGRSDYDGGHGRSGDGQGWLGWRSWSRR